MTTATLPATAARFALIDPTGHPYRGMSFGTAKAAAGYLAHLPEKSRRTLRAAGFKVGPIEPKGVDSADTPAPCCPADEPAPCAACSTTHPEPPAVAEGASPTARPATTRLTLTIGDQQYAVRRLNVTDRSFGVVKALRLRRLDNGELYDVAQTLDGHTCTCADATFRHEEGNAKCKHARALVAWGLLS